ncbi:MAG: GNAT family N-acetyltransferase [Bacteroidetes bacterium]|nr:GNAT family N-acetyltransferase [Bacteroidota bacterium]
MTGNDVSIHLLQKQGFVKIGKEDKYEILALCRPPLGQFVLETERLKLREITPDDAQFYYNLLNSPGWLENIGDRKVYNLDDARKYIIHRLFSAYRNFGFGFWVMERKTDGVPVGVAGLVKRDFLDDVDMGYALLPEFYGKGYAVEAADAVLNFAKQKLALPRLAAILIESNKPSQRVVEKIGLRFERKFIAPGDEEELMLFGVDF